MSVWVLPVGRVLHGWLGEGQAGDYAPGFFMSARLLSNWRVLLEERMNVCPDHVKTTAL